jgi:hypothetical protein
VAYSRAGLASLDLVGAVLRQGGFIDKMVGLGWTQPGRFDLVKDSAPLVRSLARYHAFLDLMQVSRGTLCVPTLVRICIDFMCYFLLLNFYRTSTYRGTPTNSKARSTGAIPYLTLGILQTMTIMSRCRCFLQHMISQPKHGRLVSEFHTASAVVSLIQNKSLASVNSRPSSVVLEGRNTRTMHQS